MNHDYKDIREKIKETPQWFDEHAVPRYCKFHPMQIADIYSSECALVLIACQDCHTEFKVVFSTNDMVKVRHMMMFGKDKPMPTLADRIKDGSLHYGDPPNIECCAAGPVMNCDDIMVLEYWHRVNLEWVRDKELEIELVCGAIHGEKTIVKERAIACEKTIGRERARGEEKTKEVERAREGKETI